MRYNKASQSLNNLLGVLRGAEVFCQPPMALFTIAEVKLFPLLQLIIALVKGTIPCSRFVGTRVPRSWLTCAEISSHVYRTLGTRVPTDLILLKGVKFPINKRE